MAAVRRELDTLAQRRANRRGRTQDLHDHRPTDAESRHAGHRNPTHQDRESSGYDHPKKGQNADRDESAGTDYLQGALVLIDNHEGAIRALVGGREYKPLPSTAPRTRRAGRWFHLQALCLHRRLAARAAAGGEHRRRRDPPRRGQGSAELESGNSDGTFGGVQPAEVGLIRSRNTMSVRVGELVGLDTVRQIGQSVGLGEHPGGADRPAGHVQHPAQGPDRSLHAVSQTSACITRPT